MLFEGSSFLEATVVEAIASAPPSTSPIDAVGAAMETAATQFRATRDEARQRAAVLAANPSLQERELLKLSTLARAVADALLVRDVAPLSATVAAQTGVTVFAVGFERWIDDSGSDQFAQCIRDVLDEVRSLTQS